MQKKRYMQNVRPMFVSLVSKAANRREFLIRKDDEGHDVEMVQVPILKSEDIDGVRYITGVAYEPGVEDTQGDQMTAAEIEKAAHLYMRDYRGVDVQHSNQPEPGCWVAESAVLKADTEIGGEMIPAGAWVMTAGIENPDVVARIDKGELNGLSIGGFAQYVMKADRPDTDETPPGWFQKLWNALVGRYGFKDDPLPEEPDETPEEQPEPKKPDPENKTKEENKPMKKSEYLALADELIAKGAMEDDTQGASAPVAKQDTAPADVGAVIAKAIADGFAAVAKAQAQQLEAPAPAATEPPAAPVEKSDAPQTIGTDDLAAIVKAAVAEQVGPMQQTVNTLAAAYNVGPKNLNGTSQPVEKGAEAHYMDGVFSA